jgi:ketosteroid isomerase-like protein
MPVWRQQGEAMRRTRTMIAAAAFATLLACNAQVEVTMDNEEDIAAVNAVRELEVSSIMSGDLTIPYAADDILIMPPNAPMVVGIEAARTWVTEFMATFTMQELRYTDAKVTVSGNLAVEHYAGSMTLVMGEGEPMTETVKGIHVYRKGADGTWKMAMDVWNSDTPMAGEM